MSVQLSIPDSVIAAIRLPEKRIEQELLVELALALYSQELLSFGKARELASMGKYEFGKLLGERGINRHYELAVISNTSPLREALVAGWLQVREVNNPSLVQLLQRDLDRGEAEAIALALLLDAVVSYDLGDKQAAIADYNQAIKINPNYAHAYYNRGNAHYLLENNQAAISDYQQAVKLYQQQGGNEDLLRKAQDRIRELQR